LASGTLKSQKSATLLRLFIDHTGSVDAERPLRTLFIYTTLKVLLTGITDPISIFIRLIGIKSLGAVVLIVGDAITVRVLVVILTALIYNTITVVVDIVTDLRPGLLTIFTGARLFTGTEMEHRNSNRSSITGVVISLSVATTYRAEELRTSFWAGFADAHHIALSTPSL